jgi:outer membrane receptor protein involved in Fe transport
LKYGALVERMQFNQSFPNRGYGVWTFSSVTNFLNAVPNRYRGTPPQFGDSFADTRQWFFGFYFQDDWQVTPKLTLNLGLRWEPYTVPVEAKGRLLQFAQSHGHGAHAGRSALDWPLQEGLGTALWVCL